MRTLILDPSSAPRRRWRRRLAQDRGEGRRARARRSRATIAASAPNAAPSAAPNAQSDSSAKSSAPRPQRAERQQGAAERGRACTAGQRAWANRQRGSRDGAVAAGRRRPRPEAVAPAACAWFAPADGGTTTDVRRDRSGDSLADRAVELRRARNGEQVIVQRDRDRYAARRSRRRPRPVRPLFGNRPALEQPLAQRPPLRLAPLSRPQPVGLPLRQLLRSLWLRLSPLLDRVQPVPELLPVELLAQRSVDVSPAAGLRPVSLGALL